MVKRFSFRHTCACASLHRPSSCSTQARLKSCSSKASGFSRSGRTSTSSAGYGCTRTWPRRCWIESGTHHDSVQSRSLSQPLLRTGEDRGRMSLQGAGEERGSNHDGDEYRSRYRLVFFDVDSTLVTIEGIDVLAAGNPE